MAGVWTYLTFLLAIATLASSAAVQPLTARCEYQGKFYSPGDSFGSACQPCQCDRSGHALCAIVDCAPPMCVDAKHDPKHCCPICENGPNCYYGSQIIPGGQDYKVNNHTTCRCPHFQFGFNGNRAVCTQTVNAVS